jgi:hypothetical protein
MSQYREVKTVQHEPGREQRLLTAKISQLILFVFLILEALFALRVVLKLIGANPNSLFAILLYGFTDLFLFPFFNLVPSPTFGSFVFEVSTLIAMAVYGLIGWAIERIVVLIFYRPKSPVIIEHSEITEHVPAQPQLGVRRTTVIDHTPRRELEDENTLPHEYPQERH